ncbi:MAG: carbamoyltransferase [Gemmatimonadetes bacterium]|nr:carbamoyltransferase [Gemmatimonadota bacterium]
MAVILGINALHPGASAALVVDGKPVAAIAEERLNRRKYWAGFPRLAIAECLRMAGLTLADVEFVAIGRDARANRGQKIAAALQRPGQLLTFGRMLLSRRALGTLHETMAEAMGAERGMLRFKAMHVEHHLAHIASSYFTSPFEHCAALSVDGSGDFVSAMLARCTGPEIAVTHRTFLPDSLGFLYSMACQFIGYPAYGDEGKVMGLAPYGSKALRDWAEGLVQLDDDGVRLTPGWLLPFGKTEGFTLDDEGNATVQRLWGDRMRDRFGEPRDPAAEVTQREMDIAWGVQHAFERAYLHLVRRAAAEVPGGTDLVLAGGCALNSVANGMIETATPFRRSVVHPAAGDDGLALGAALYVSQAILADGPRLALANAYLGPEYTSAEIARALEAAGLPAVPLARDARLDAAADAIARGEVVGWFSGRMEWGPRALGARSILAHPGRADMKEILNARIKRREWFRPFAPAVLAERQGELFDSAHPSPFMLHVHHVRPEWRERLAAVTHVDGTGRLQTVTRDASPDYYDLIARFEARTGLPVVLNTSFNENEPIVCRPEEAIECFLRTRMDVLAIGDFVIRKPPVETPPPVP